MDDSRGDWNASGVCLDPLHHALYRPQKKLTGGYYDLNVV